MVKNCKFPSIYSNKQKKFKCVCCSNEFETNSYDEYPINENDKCVGKVFITYCPECDNEVLEDEYFQTYHPKPYRYLNT